MAQNLVLIRHGKAQPFKTDIDDAARTLTPAGRRALRATLPESLMSLGLMPEFLMGDVEVWSSTAVRALETAEAVAAMLDVEEIVTHQSLFEQDFEAFMQELEESPADVVVAVGHEPFTGIAAERLCGVELPFKTASMAAFDLSAYAGEPKDTVLRHFSQGPRTENWKNLVKLEEILCKAAARVEETMALFLENPEDVEALHDFRVSIRTLRSELSFLKPYIEPEQVKYLQLNLRNLVVKTSRQRELDVLAGMLSAAESPNEELIALIDKLRRKERKLLLAEIGTKKVVKRTCKLLDRVEHLDWKQHIENGGLCAEDLIARFELIQLKFESAYLKTDYSDVEQTHDLRKAAKRVRYASREFGALLGGAAEGVPEAMCDVQDELGALCDARVNCEIADSLPRQKLSKEARAALKAFKKSQLAIIQGILENDCADDTMFELVEARIDAELEAEPAKPADEEPAAFAEEMIDLFEEAEEAAESASATASEEEEEKDFERREDF